MTSTKIRWLDYSKIPVEDGACEAFTPDLIKHHLSSEQVWKLSAETDWRILML
ncbi:hypothetical protein [Endozoicomonas numazuensis]|uniref:hypothetical protein n=1 Tax=Endozoicomonas numazuensis TaxID=1137799 RepID=UPI000A4839B8|nr:hypothetical protein [Endozoicomonas numazuensis]